MLSKIEVARDHHEADHQEGAEENLSVLLELELRVEVKLSNKGGSENKDHTCLGCRKTNSDGLVCSESDSSKEQHHLNEPGLPPVDIILAMSQKVYLLPLLSSKSKSLPNGLESLEACYGKEKHDTNDIKIECDDLISQPGHYMRIIGDLCVFLESYSGLHHLHCVKVDAHLKDQEQVCQGFLVVVVQHLVQVMENY